KESRGGEFPGKMDAAFTVPHYVAVPGRRGRKRNTEGDQGGPVCCGTAESVDAYVSRRRSFSRMAKSPRPLVWCGNGIERCDRPCQKSPGVARCDCAGG